MQKLFGMLNDQEEKNLLFNWVFNIGFNQQTVHLWMNILKKKKGLEYKNCNLQLHLAILS